MKVLIIGCGQIGIECARLLHSNGHEVSGLRRNGSKLPGWINRLSGDVFNKDSLKLLASTSADLVIYQVAASGFNEEAYRAAYITGLCHSMELLENRAIPFLFVSSTSVYHQDDGSWVDESSPVQPQSFNGQIMLQAEQLVAERAGSASIRFSGIYGPERLRLIEQVRSGAANVSADSGAVVTNRIHSFDCAAVLAHLSQLYLQPGLQLPPLWLASDSEPASRADVFSFIKDQLGVDSTADATSDKDENRRTLPAAERSTSTSAGGDKPQRRAGSKRCSNRQLIDSGYQFKYPDYRSGYRDIIANLQQ